MAGSRSKETGSRRLSSPLSPYQKGKNIYLHSCILCLLLNDSILSYSVLKGRVPNRDHLPPIHRYGYSSGAEGAQHLGPQEAAAHQDLQAPHHRQPHLPQPLLRLQKPQEEARVSAIFIWYQLNVLMGGRKVTRRQTASSEMLSQSVFFIYLDDLPQRVGQLHLHVVDFGPD